MTKTEMLMQERDDLQVKIASAREATGPSDRETSDLKMMEQELLALEQRIGRAGSEKATGSGGTRAASPTEKLDRKLDAALKDSFPASDPVSFLEAAPAAPVDESVTQVKTGKRQ